MAQRRDDPRRPGERDRQWEGPTFDPRDRYNSDEARYEPWRSGAPFDQDRVGYGMEAYGVEGGRAHEARRDERRGRGGGDDERETWGPDVGEPYGDLELNPRNRGVQEFGPPADYAYHPPAGHEFDPDYLRWRDEQMRAHDHEYAEWRRERQRRYDEDYRRARADRRREPRTR
jgi:hypothetical protein